MTVDEVLKLTNGERVCLGRATDIFATVFVHEGVAKLLWEGGPNTLGRWEEVTPETVKGLRLLKPSEKREVPEKPHKQRGMPRPDVDL